MYSDNKQIRDVADVAAKIMYGQQPVTEKLHPNQQQLDVHEPEKDELTADDFKKLRAKKSGVVKEDDTGYQDRFAVKNGKAVKHNPEKGEHDEPHHVWADSPEHAVRKHAQMNKPKTEQVEAIDEVKLADLPSRKIQGRAYGSSRPEPHAVDTIKGPNDDELKKIEAEKKKKKFSEMVNLYQDKGLKSLSEMLVKEEPDNEQFTKELEDAKAKSEGKKTNTEIAKGAVQAVKQEETEITDEMIFEVLENAGIDFESLSDNELQEVANEAYEILDELSKNTLGSYIKKANYAGGMADFKHGRIADKRGNSKEKTSLATTSTKRQKGISTAVNKLSKEEVEQVEERHMTDGEMDKRETIVKSMKKGFSGFKDRYGDRAKNVMYATANKQAMKD